MKRNKASNIIRWTARIYGGLVFLIPIIALAQVVRENRTFHLDWRTYVFYLGLIIGLLIAYKRELTGGLIATLGLLVSGFIHPLLLPLACYIFCFGFLEKGAIK